MNRILTGLLVLLLVLTGWQYLRAQSLANDRDEYAADLTVERAKARGLESEVADARRRFGDLAESHDSLMTGLDSLLNELGGLRARNAALVGMVAAGEGSGTADSVVVVQVDTVPGPDSVTATFSGPPLWATVRCDLDPVACDWDWRAIVEGRILLTTLADGRVLAVAETETPGFTLNIASAEYVPERPESLLSRLWGSRWTRAGLVLGVGGVVCLRVC